MNFPNWKRLLDISPESWLIAAAAALLSYLVLSAALRLIAGRIRALARRSETLPAQIAAEVLLHTNRFLLLLVALLIGFGTIDLTPNWSLWLEHGWVLALGLQIGLWLNRGIDLWLNRQTDSTAQTDQRNRATTTTLVFLLRLLVWVTVALAMLANLGVNVTALVASLGIGGIAVALALQTILSDLFASLAIAFDKPFEIGDFIIFGDTLGTVTHIGVKTTRIQSLSGERVVISNTELLKQTVHNYKYMQQRRVVFGFRLSYRTPVEQVEEISRVTRQIIESVEQTRFDRAHFKTFGDSALEYEVVYYVLSPDYNVYMDIQQRINLELMRACAARGVRFGHPLRVLQEAAAEEAALERPAAG